MSPTHCMLTAAQIRILQVLRDANGPVTRSALVQAAGASNVTEVLGYTLDTLGREEVDQSPGSLMALHYVHEEKYTDVDSGRQERTYELTGEGKSAVDAYKVAPRRLAHQRVEKGILDECVLRMRPTRSYGIECWTTDDLTELRDMLGDGYEDIDLIDLRKQVENRRKQGAFAPPGKKEISSLEKLLREFGDSGTVIAELLTPEQVKRVKARLTRLKNGK